MSNSYGDGTLIRRTSKEREPEAEKTPVDLSVLPFVVSAAQRADVPKDLIRRITSVDGVEIGGEEVLTEDAASALAANSNASTR